MRRFLSVVFLALLLVARLHSASAAPPTGGTVCGRLYATAGDGARVLLALESTEVVLGVNPGVLEAQVTQTFTNRTATALEATYLYPLPDGATLTDFELHFRDRVIRSRVLEKKQARRTYEEAKEQGRKSALVEQHDPALFSTAVANFLPGETVQVVIRFVQPVRLTLESVDVRFPMVTGDKYFPDVTAIGTPGHAAENPARNSALAAQHLYSFEVNVAGFPVTKITSLSHRIATDDLGGDRHAVRLLDEVTVPDRDFLLHLELSRTAEVRPTLVTQHTALGEFGLLTLFPPVTRARSAKADAPRDVLFVIDCSDSMSGRRIGYAQLGLDGCLAMLRPSDRFHIVPFGSTFSFYRPGWTVASRAEIAAARKFVGALPDLGGTEMQPALEAGLEKFARNHREHDVVFLTDGDVGNEATLLKLVTEKIGDARLFTFGIGAAPNARLLRRMAELGHGQVRFILNERTVEEQLIDLFATLDAPVLSNVKVTLLDANGASLDADFLPAEPGNVYLGRPLQTMFRIEAGRVAAVRIDALEDGVPVSYQQTVEGRQLRGDGLEKHFGALLYEECEMRGYLAEKADSRDAAFQQALETALLFNLVTERTSRVAVDTTLARDPSAPLSTQVVPQAKPADQAAAEKAAAVQAAQAAEQARQAAAYAPGALSTVDGVARGADGQDVVVLTEFSVRGSADGNRQVLYCRTGGCTRFVTRDGCYGDVTEGDADDLLRFLPPLRPELVAPTRIEFDAAPVPNRTLDAHAIVDGLPFTTLLDPKAIAEIGTAAGPSRAWITLRGHNVEYRAEAVTTTVRDGGGTQATWQRQWRPSETPLLERVASTLTWNHADRDHWGARLSGGGEFGRVDWDAHLQARHLGGFGGMHFEDVSLTHRFAARRTVELRVANHALHRDTPWQFARSAAPTRVEGLGQFNLDLLTAPASRVADRWVGLNVRHDMRCFGGSALWSLRGATHHREADWATLSHSMDSRDSSVLGSSWIWTKSSNREFLSASVERTWHRTPGADRAGEQTNRITLEGMLPLSSRIALTAQFGREDELPWLPSGVARFSGTEWRATALPVEGHRNRQAGVVLGHPYGKWRTDLTWFDERVGNFAYRDWAWERDHAAGGETLLPDGSRRSAFSYASRRELRRTGWRGAVQWRPGEIWKTVLTGEQGSTEGAPFSGGGRIVTLTTRVSIPTGLFRGSSVGATLTNRSAMTYNDGFVLPAGTTLDCQFSYGWEHQCGNPTHLQLTLGNVTGRAWQPTRFAPDRGRQVLFTVSQGF